MKGSPQVKFPSGKIRRSTLWLMLMVMPVGVRIDGEHDSELTLEGHAGTGQVISVVRDCSGRPIASHQNTYSDFAGAFQYSHRTGDGDFLVVGIRGGRLTSNYQPASGHFPYVIFPEYEYEYTYWNPYLAWEGPYMGVGVGYLSEAPSLDFGDIQSSTPLSAHLRVGNYAKAHFLATYNENLPLASGGGYINLGVGYPAGDRLQMFTGFSGTPYDRIGLVQKISWRLSESFDLDLDGRAGNADGYFEGGLSLGLRYHLPLGPQTGPNPFLEKRGKEKSPEKKAGYQEIGSLDSQRSGPKPSPH
jgi:hypothetical protein